MQRPVMLQVVIPSELFRPILESGELDKADLCSVALASRLLREEGQRIIFRDPGLIAVQMGKKIGRAFFHAVLSSPHRLALMVRIYTQTTEWMDYMLSAHRRVQEELFMEMTEALRLMVNLKIFHSSHVGGRNSYTPGSMVDCLRQCVFRLKEFSWKHEGEEIRLVEEFLVSQDDIRTLYLDQGFDIREAWDVNNNHAQRLLIAGRRACPKLESLHGPMSCSRVLLPGKRNMKFIAWTWAFWITEGLGDIEFHGAHVCDALRTLQYLEYESSAGTGLPFSKIAPYLNSLVFLTMSNKQMRLVSALSSGLPELRAIYFFNEGFWHASSPEEFAHDYELVSSIFVRCRKLQFIDVDRHRDPSPGPLHNEDHGHISRRFNISQETGEVTSKRVDRPQEEWWKDRVHIVTKLCAQT